MGYGVTASTGLATLSYSPVQISSVVHVVEIGTSFVNGWMHWKSKNINWRVAALVGIPGGIAAFAGAVLLSVANATALKPWIAGLFVAMGFRILFQFSQRTSHTPSQQARPPWILALGTASGFIDATTGGGWGVMTTSTLTATKVLSPSQTIGTTTTARFFVALMGTLGFVTTLGLVGLDWVAVAGMGMGAIVATPFVRIIVTRSSQRALGIMIGFVLIALNSRQICVSMEMEFLGVIVLTSASVICAGLSALLWSRSSKSRGL